MLFLALKQLRARPRQTILTFIAIVLGSTGYVVFSGMMLGFQDRILDNLVNNDAHVKISARDDLITAETFRGIFFEDGGLKWAVRPSGKTDSTRLNGPQIWYQRLQQDTRVEAFAPQLARQVIFVRGRFSVPGSLVGIMPSRQKKITNLERNMVQGSMDDLSRGGSPVILGQEILNKLGARVGETIRIVAANGTSHPVKITGIFRVGSRTLEAGLAYTTLETAQNIAGTPGEISIIGVRLKDIAMAESAARDWSNYSNQKVESWEKANEGILTVFFTQNLVRNITTLTIILVVSFGIYNIQNMVVNQKKREIAILRSIGFSRRDVVLLFLYQGLLLGLTGAGLGLGIGGLLCMYLSTITLPGTQPLFNKLIISYNPQIYLRAFLISCGSSLLASYFPARAAGRLSPIEVIRQS